MTTDLGKTISDLETKAQDLETETQRLKSVTELQSVQLAQLEKQNTRLSSERDQFMTQNAALTTLIKAASALIIDGLQKVDVNERVAQAVVGSMGLPRTIHPDTTQHITMEKPDGQN